MSGDFPELCRDIASAVMVEKPGGYMFRKYGIGEESSLFRSEVTEEVCAWAREIHVFGQSDFLAGIEPGGLPWALLFGFLYSKSVLPLRSSHCALPSLEGSSTRVRNLYSKKNLFLEKAGYGEKVGLVDDIVSSGETLLHAAQLIKDRGFELTSISVILARDVERVARIEDQLGLRVNVMCTDQHDQPDAPGAG